MSKDKFFWDYYQKVKEMAARVPGVEILTDVLDDQWLDLYKRCTTHTIRQEGTRTSP